jgi:ActR/RegA family two-component response regulator
MRYAPKLGARSSVTARATELPMYLADDVIAALADEHFPFRGSPPYPVRLSRVRWSHLHEALLRHGMVVTHMERSIFGNRADLVCYVAPVAR